MTKSKRPPTPNLRDFKKIADVDPRKILPPDMDPKNKRFLYTALAILVIIVLIIAVIYIGRHSQGGLLGNPSASSSATGDGEEQNVKTESLEEVRNPHDAVDPATAYAPNLSTAKKELAALPVKERASKAGYTREQFGAAWDDVDHNGCNTRDDILRRDLTNIRFKAGTRACTVQTGTLDDPYTGRTIEFKRGKKSSSAVQIDHVVALSNAWQTGAQDIGEEKRRELANDPENLVAADGPANMQKSDADASDWLPGNTAYRCTYVARQVHVKAKYQLWVTADEKRVMENVLNSCKDTNPVKK
ncbi:HNH endonuclease family protein [Rothia dentocariosa]